MDNGLKDFIQELRDYGNARKGELAGMMLEAANRLEVFQRAHERVYQEICRCMAWEKILQPDSDDITNLKSYVCGLAFAKRLMSEKEPKSILPTEDEIEQMCACLEKAREASNAGADSSGL